MADYSKYEPYLHMLEFKDVGPVEAERIAEKCFHAQSWLVKDLANAEYKELIVTDNEELKKSELLLQVPSEYTNAESRKAWVYVQPARKTAAEKRIVAKTEVDYLKRLLRLFEQAANFYGQKARR